LVLRKEKEMYLYTKCSKCCKELTVKDVKKNSIVDGIYINEKILCNQCNATEQRKMLLSICDTYDLDNKTCTTYIEDNTTFLSKNLGVIDKDYYGTNDYDFVVNTKTMNAGIMFNGTVFSLEGMNKDDIKRTIKLVEFMCSKE
jgi:hypothetical protein